MKEYVKVPAKLKYKPEDFIVEEIGENNWKTNISKEFPVNKNPDFFGLDFSAQKDFLCFELEKRNIDHFSAMKELSFSLSGGLASIGYAGIKDKAAWTTQRISVFKPDFEKLKLFSHPNIYLKNFKWSKRKIKIGYLLGNNFKIVLRDIDKKDAMTITNKIRGTEWFPNYFGPQRFGRRKNNDKIGKLILKKKFKEAVWAILTDVGEENEEITKSRLKLKQDGDLFAAQGYFPPHLKLETRIIDYLIRNEGDYFGAIFRVDRKIMLIFVNALQSRIFNEILSRALEEGLDFTREGQKSCLLVGYRTRFFKGRLGEIEQQVLKENNLELEDFNLREIGYLRMKGSFRRAITEVRNLGIELEDDEEFEFSKKITLNFELPSGVYATTFLENFFILD